MERLLVGYHTIQGLVFPIGGGTYPCIGNGRIKEGDTDCKEVDIGHINEVCEGPL